MLSFNAVYVLLVHIRQVRIEKYVIAFNIKVEKRGHSTLSYMDTFYRPDFSDT